MLPSTVIAGTTVTLQTSEHAAEVIFSVHSIGPVIPPADFERIFDRYYRSSASSNRAPGTGYRTFGCEANRSSPGRSCLGHKRHGEGNHFLCIPPHSVARRGSPMTSLSANAPVRVLLVDDEPSIRRALRTPLSEMGFPDHRGLAGRRGAAPGADPHLRRGSSGREHAGHGRHETLTRSVQSRRAFRS